jgi:hypothetical protein
MGICGSKKKENIIDLFNPRNDPNDICIFSCVDENTNIKPIQQAWVGMHYLIQSIPEKINSDSTIECIMTYLLCIGRLLPCVECGDHWIIFMKAIYKHRKILFNTPHSGTCFLYDLHNFWNKLKHKPVFTCDEYKETYGYDKNHTPMLEKIMTDKIVASNIEKIPYCSRPDKIDKHLEGRHVTTIT